MQEQRHTFDEVADVYAAVRPGVPEPAVDALWTHLALPPGGHVVEVGCGTGKLTEHLARRGARVTALDPGTKLLAQCAEAVTGCDVTLVESTFEAWEPGEVRCEAVTACQAAHWIDPDAFLAKTCALLEPGGRVGLLWHIDTSEGSAFWGASQPLYDRYLPDAPDKPPRTIPLHVAAYEAALRADARFAAQPRERWPWSRTFDPDSYALMLTTHSPVRMLGEDDRAAFIAGHRRLIAEVGGSVVRTYETVLLAATLTLRDSTLRDSGPSSGS